MKKMILLKQLQIILGPRCLFVNFKDFIEILKNFKQLTYLEIAESKGLILYSDMKDLLKEIFRLPKLKELILNITKNQPTGGYDLLFNNISRFVKYNTLILAPFYIEDPMQYPGLVKKLGWIHDLSALSFKKSTEETNKEVMRGAEDGQFDQVIEAIRKAKDFHL